MTEKSGDTVDRGSAAKREERQPGGIDGKARAKGEGPSPEEPAPVDLDSAHDRAS